MLIRKKREKEGGLLEATQKDLYSHLASGEGIVGGETGGGEGLTFFGFLGLHLKSFFSFGFSLSVWCASR